MAVPAPIKKIIDQGTTHFSAVIYYGTHVQLRDRRTVCRSA